MDWLTFGSQIREKRIAKGLTQQGLAEIVEVTPVSISYYETGKKHPAFDKLRKICKELDISMDEL